MDNAKSSIETFTVVKAISELSGVEITNKMSYDDFFKSCLEKMKLEIHKLHFGTVVKLINFLEESEPLAEWMKEVLAVLYERKSMILYG